MAELMLSTQRHVRAQTQLVFWVCVLASIGALASWYVDGAQGLNTAWDDIGAPAIGLTFAAAAAMLHWRPAWLDAIVTSALIPTSIYYLGVLYVAAQDQTPKGLYSMASNSQFMPLYYVGAFVALRKRAALISWLHYGCIAGLYVYQYGIVASTQAANQPNAHVWATLLISHPGYIVALHYITALKGRLRSAELASHQSKERFLAMLSHEIRSPLQAMLGSIDLLALKASSPPEHRAVGRIRHAASQLDTHLRDVTEYTRLENPAWRLQCQAVDMVALVQEVCDHYQGLAQSKGLELDCDVPLVAPPALKEVWTDSARVRQILDNLIGNALKYTMAGRITVRAQLSPEQNGIQLDVQDTGIGIPEHDRARIFEPYVRLEDRSAGAVEGSGLGLAIVKRLVDRLDGVLHLRSVLGQGSCFTVILPLKA